MYNVYGTCVGVWNVFLFEFLHGVCRAAGIWLGGHLLPNLRPAFGISPAQILQRHPRFTESSPGVDLSFVRGKLRIGNNLRFVLQVAGGLSQHCLKPIVDVIGPLSIPPQGLRLNSDPAISTPPYELWPKMSHFLEIRPHFFTLGGTDWLTGSW